MVKNKKGLYFQLKVKGDKVSREILMAQRGSLGIQSISMKAYLVKVDSKETKESLRSSS